MYCKGTSSGLTVENKKTCTYMNRLFSDPDPKNGTGSAKLHSAMYDPMLRSGSWVEEGLRLERLGAKELMYLLLSSPCQVD